MRLARCGWFWLAGLRLGRVRFTLERFAEGVRLALKDVVEG